MSIEAMKRALEALWMANTRQWPENKIGAAINALSAAIEQAEKQEQCKEHGECFGGKCIYTTPTAAQQEAVLAEREACAKLCDEMEASGALSSLEKYRTRFIADAIRARGKA